MEMNLDQHLNAPMLRQDFEPIGWQVSVCPILLVLIGIPPSATICKSLRTSIKGTASIHLDLEEVLQQAL